jgi:hypothetical protein
MINLHCALLPSKTLQRQTNKFFLLVRKASVSADKLTDHWSSVSSHKTVLVCSVRSGPKGTNLELLQKDDVISDNFHEGHMP